MEETKKMPMAVLLGGLLIAILVGVARASPNDTPLASPGTKLTIPAAYFHPIWDGCDYTNEGYQLRVHTGSCAFTAPVIFPGKVTVNSITLYAFDWDGGKDFCVDLFRTAPHNANQKLMGTACTSGVTDTNPRVFTDGSIAYNPVRRKHGSFLWLSMGASSNLTFYGVKIDYTKL